MGMHCELEEQTLQGGASQARARGICASTLCRAPQRVLGAPERTRGEVADRPAGAIQGR